LVNNPSTVGRISKWVSSSNNGTGTIGDSVIIESSIGTIGIGTNPFSDFKLGVDGGSTIAGGVFGFSSVFNGTGLRGRAGHPNSGTGVSGFGTTGLYGETVGNNPNGNNIGVWGVATSTGSIGVSGQNSAGGLAGKFDGNVTINGNFSVSGTANLTASNAIQANNADTATNATNANAVTNGVYTTGSYANPSWITSLAGSKITGVVANATNSVNAGTADTVKVPLALSGTNNLLSLTGAGGVPTLIINNTETGGGAGIQSTISGNGNAILAYNNGSGAAIHAESFGGEPTIKGISKTTFGGAGVYGLSSIANGIGVFGENNGGGAGVYGRSNGSGNALEGHSLDPSGSGLYATNNSGGLAGRFDGNVTVNGSLNATSINAGNLVNGVNGLSGAVTLAAGDNVTITPSVNTLTISMTGGGASSNPQINPQQLALLRWYSVNQSSDDTTVGFNPRGIAFDGAHVWVSNNGGDTVSKVRSSDGEVVGTYSSGGGSPWGIAYDGTNIWVVNNGTNTVSKMRARDGSTIGTYTLGGTYPVGVTYDGTHIWVVVNGLNSVAKLNVNGTILGTYPVGLNPYQLAFDGANIWVANAGNGTVSKIRASDGASQGTFSTGGTAFGVVFDGANIWVSNYTGQTVTKLKASDGSLVGNFPVNNGPGDIAFDGANIWVCNSDSSTVTKLRATDGFNLGTFAVGAVPAGIAFDGANVWVGSYLNHKVSKR
jgi:hypothetical protein